MIGVSLRSTDFEVANHRGSFTLAPQVQDRLTVVRNDLEVEAGLFPGLLLLVERNAPDPRGYERQSSTTTRSAAHAVATTAQATAKTTRRARVEFMAKFFMPGEIFNG